jgi:folate-binding protein YgfZ
MSTETLRIARRPRDFVRVRGRDAADYLQRMLSNDVVGLAVGAACEALLLTAKARVIAPLVVVRRENDDYLLLTEPGLGERVVHELRRSRFAAQAEIEPEHHSSVVVFGTSRDGIPTADYGEPAVEVLDEDLHGDEVPAAELELMRIRAKTPRYGREIDDRVLPAEAGLVERAVSFTKGCYPGQEPIARLHHRGHANRGLRVLELETDETPPLDADVRFGEKSVGRVTSAARGSDGRVYALAYVRVEVPEHAPLAVEGKTARSLD